MKLIATPNYYKRSIKFETKRKNENWFFSPKQLGVKLNTGMPNPYFFWLYVHVKLGYINDIS